MQFRATWKILRIHEEQEGTLKKGVSIQQTYKIVSFSPGFGD